VNTEGLWRRGQNDWSAGAGQKYLDRNTLTIAIGPEGSGSRKFWLDLLKASHEVDLPTVLSDLVGEAANKALKEGRVDVVITLGTADNVFVQDLLHSQNVKLMSLSQAEAYTRVFPALSHVILPKGVVNLTKRLPASDIHLVSPTTNLVVRDTMHPALMYLLLDAAVEIHGGSGWVHKAGEFPSPKVQDFPLSDQAERFYKTMPPYNQASEGHERNRRRGKTCAGKSGQLFGGLQRSQGSSY
jgi:TRAP-type uncharacterized transport system substrate-binding protein